MKHSWIHWRVIRTADNGMIECDYGEERERAVFMTRVENDGYGADVTRMARRWL